MEDLKTKNFLVVADGYIPQRHCCVRIVDEEKTIQDHYRDWNGEGTYRVFFGIGWWESGNDVDFWICGHLCGFDSLVRDGSWPLKDEEEIEGLRDAMLEALDAWVGSCAQDVLEAMRQADAGTQWRLGEEVYIKEEACHPKTLEDLRAALRALALNSYNPELVLLKCVSCFRGESSQDDFTTVVNRYRR